jgi:teichuronic acid biosynthesis glycosyltransferase TuaG
MIQDPKVSIIMPAYNAEAFIEESIASVQNQIYFNWELIIVDDGSVDNTGNIVKKISEADSRIIYIYQENKKIAAARNSGLKIAKGEYIAFLDSDDLWTSDKLTKQIEVFKKIDVEVVFSDGFFMYEETKILDEYNTIHGLFKGHEMYKLEFERNYIPILSVMFKTEYINKVGLQGEENDLVGCEDFDYWLRLSKYGATFYGLPDRLFKYRVHKSSMSTNKVQMRLAEITALINNIDYSLLENKIIENRLAPLIIQRIHDLLGENNNLAVKQLKQLISIKWRLNYFFVYQLLKNNLLKNKDLIKFLLAPGHILLKFKSG